MYFHFENGKIIYLSIYRSKGYGNLLLRDFEIIFLGEQENTNYCQLLNGVFFMDNVA